MAQSIDFEYNEETDEFHLVLEGEDCGPVDMDDLRTAADDLYMHFHMFRDHPPVSPEGTFDGDLDDLEDSELTDEDLDEIIEELEEEAQEMTDEEREAALEQIEEEVED